MKSSIKILVFVRVVWQLFLGYSVVFIIMLQENVSFILRHLYLLCVFGSYLDVFVRDSSILKVKEVGSPTRCKSNHSCYYSIHDISRVGIDVHLYQLKHECRQRLRQIKHTKGLRIILKFKAQHLRQMRISSAVLEAPSEAHSIGKPVELV